MRPFFLLGAASLALSACNVPVLLMSPGMVATCDTTPTATMATGYGVYGRVTMPAGFYLEASGAGKASDASPEAERAVADADVSVGDTQGNAIPGLPTGRTDANGGFSVPDIPSSFSYVVKARRTVGEKQIELKTLVQTSKTSSTAIDVNAATTLVTETVTQGRKGLMRTYTSTTYDRAVAIVLSYIRTGNVPDLSNRAGMVAWVEALSLRVPELRTALDALVIEIYGPLPAPSPSVSPSALPPASPSPSVPPAVSTARVVTLVGEVGGYQDATARRAQFNFPTGVVVGVDTAIYLTDMLNHAVRRVTLKGEAADAVGTFAGNGEDGYLNAQGAEARFYRPTGLAKDALGNLYVADTGSHRIRRISRDGTVSLLAGSGGMGATDGPAHAASFSSPAGLAVDGAGNVYVADAGNHRIRKIAPDGAVSTLAGSSAGFADAVGPAARFNDPQALAWDAQGFLYVADTGGHRIRRVSADGTVSTVAGVSDGFADGPASQARFKSPRGLALSNGRLLVADEGNHRIRSIDLATATVATLAGNGVVASTDGPALEASFRAPAGLAIDHRGWIYVTEPYNHRLRVIR